ncbi:MULTISPECIES: hypothetical protein [Vibrio harveyi group]|uniref:hypothetical protein n=1 Tax=Vibrio harveyi group TaxID=717610 RepID=UPI001BD57B7B|nr:MULTISPECIES: hypothetical protein [Vibrio harveyi group]MBT0014496.1 hypothetical protein [Vibrio alginolyticus]MCG9621676.1 hypothetical protein [Vibrio diabolicus]MDF4654221.1 hypothetical protein [Vibrio parahaemolyticus]
MSIKERFLQLKEQVNSAEINGDTYYYKRLTGRVLEQSKKLDEEVQGKAAFALCVCEEDGSPIFTLDDLELIDELPVDVVSILITYIYHGNDAKKLLGD